MKMKLILKKEEKFKGLKCLQIKARNRGKKRCDNCACACAWEEKVIDTNRMDRKNFKKGRKREKRRKV